MAIEVIDFSQKEANLIADILQGVFQVAEAVGGTDESLDLFGEFIDALEDGATIRVVEA